MQVFLNQPWQPMLLRFADFIVWKTKALFGKDVRCQEKNVFLHTLFLETREQKWGAMFFYQVEGHMQKYFRAHLDE